MLPIERQRRIMEILTLNSRVLVAELVSLLQVSQETIRRDLASLEKKGMLLRSHGGAVLAQKHQGNIINNINKNNEYELTFHQRTNENISQKMQIAKRALDFISVGDCLLLDSSTTCWFLARQLPDIELTVITNSLRTVQTLAPKGNIRTICLGGEYSDRDEDFNGVVAEQPLKEFLINKIFFSCSSLGNDGYLREGNENKAHLKQQMLLASERKYLLMDASKFLHPSFARICHYRDVDFLITDKMDDKDLTQELAWNGVNIIDCSQRPQSMQLINN
ncbi:MULTISPECIES: DeoR/GlpR family DNA-binding transcription regulator [Pectobacterium]|uniref:DeoR/GlpR transcriptional regulator n=1 Tax=Pectobacterium punjabense TaxID=2108399 RepID=A0ABX6L5Q7_9GAMM|nr:MULTISPECIES: DeoR/GlpR family DNA-binding transcription regulator [Pectobacterium]GKW11955.1 DeoR family transcriptional regulator [Pectobacterium carotovorum subsp. carotovorum]MBS4430595.1 DeoR/GlpR transcriptional regulator [Pectobacterium punjabense]MBT9183710.1 DeoR/GlpR transcriptional regulator [Pectobacterium punjabense]MCE9733331.1 DeoR family transcriptional regulator [Pectobacterium sp. IFB5596]MDG0797288.1 DeoR/GlpR family DNA-binding transcription regulator [Pectobacterium pun